MKLFNLSKRQWFVISVVILSVGFFLSEFLVGINFVFSSIILAILTDLILFLILRKDINGTFYYPILILPFLYTFAFSSFYLLIPARLISRVIITTFYGFGLYSLMLTQNIFAVSGIRTINLLRSARIVSFVLTILILFFLVNTIFSLYLPIYFSALLYFFIFLLINFQSFWIYTLDKSRIKEILIHSVLLAIALVELAVILIIWPVNSSIYAIFITGMFYTYSGLSHNWFEKRLFKGILWEYIWVAFLSIFLLILFSKWGV